MNVVSSIVYSVEAVFELAIVDLHVHALPVEVRYAVSKRRSIRVVPKVIHKSIVIRVEDGLLVIVKCICRTTERVST